MATKKRPCSKCGKPCTATECRSCWSKSVRRKAESDARKCVECGTALHRTTSGDRCYRHRAYHRSSKIFQEEKTGTTPAPKQHYTGEAVVLVDTHIPFHNVRTLQQACILGQLLGIKRLIVAGDLVDQQKLAHFARTTRVPTITEEFLKAGRVLEGLKAFFPEILCIPGNHDFRAEKKVSDLEQSPKGRQALQLLTGCLDIPEDSVPQEIALAYINHFLGGEGFTMLEFPQITLNNHWLIQHPGSSRKIAPQLEREFATIEHKSTVQGHAHLWGLGFDVSGKFVSFALGPACDDEYFHWKYKKPKPWPKQVRGVCAIYQTKESPEGRLLPVALHDRMFDLREVAERFARNLNTLEKVS